MAKPKWHTRWKVLPHNPLTQLEDNLMVVDGPIPGMPLERRMTIVRLSDGRLAIHNAMALDDASMARIEAWGTPAFLIVPNHFHRIDAFAFKARYPDLKVIAGPRGAPKVGQAVPVDGGPELLPAGLGLRGENLDGDKVGEMAFIVTHGKRATLIVNDALFNMAHIKGFTGLIVRLMGSTGGLKLTRIMRWFGVSDTRAFKAHLARLADTPGLTRLIVSHGAILEGADVGAKIRAAVGLSSPSS